MGSFLCKHVSSKLKLFDAVIPYLHRHGAPFLLPLFVRPEAEGLSKEINANIHTADCNKLAITTTAI